MLKFFSYKKGQSCAATSIATRKNRCKYKGFKLTEILVRDRAVLALFTKLGDLVTFCHEVAGTLGSDFLFVFNARQNLRLLLRVL